MPRSTHDVFACSCAECQKRQRAMLREWRHRQYADEFARHTMTQEEAADEFGVHPRTWRRYENGELRVPLWLLRQFERMKKGET